MDLADAAARGGGRKASDLFALSIDRLLFLFAILCLIAGAVAAWRGDAGLAAWIWTAGVVPVLLFLLITAVQAILRGRVGVDFIALLSMAGALLLDQQLAGVVIALMFTGGTVLEDYAGRRARRELTALLGRAPRQAHREIDGRLEDIEVEQVAIGEVVLVKHGEVVPVDGQLLAPEAVLDEASLTGEALPVQRRYGETVRSGGLNVGAPIRLKALSTAAESTYAGIIRLVEAAEAEKAPFVRLADRYALLFLPLALAIAGGAWLLTGDPVRALAVLVVATPCPLLLAAPVAIMGGMSAAARRGILVKGGGALEALASAATLVFDKTGTLTTGRARLVAIEARDGLPAEELLRLSASLDQMSSHPLAAAILEAARRRDLVLTMPEQVQEEAGSGLEGVIDGRRVRLGRLDYAVDRAEPPDWAERLAARAHEEGSSSVFVVVDGHLAGALLLADEIRAETPRALRRLRLAGLRRIIMLSGDRQDAAEVVAGALGVDTVLAERSPEDKVDAVRAERAEGVTIMTGDGVNDAPALAAADVGVAIGARGAGAAGEAADIVLVSDRLDRLAEGVSIARRTRRIARESVIAGMAMSAVGMLAAAFGFLPPLAGALLQEVIDVLVILNALRAIAAGGRPLAALPAETLGEIRAEHKALTPIFDQLRSLADRLDVDDRAALGTELQVIAHVVGERLLPHEQDDETRLHPEVAPLLGGHDPMAAISRTHREIVHLGRRLLRLIAEMPAEGPRDADLPALRRVLYSLDAILRLHFAQEEEIYDSLTADAGPGHEPAGTAARAPSPS
ncbi:MAG: heavy metal translocating P-type ATPase [Alphaproteobacteria bacterium]